MASREEAELGGELAGRKEGLICIFHEPVSLGDTSRKKQELSFSAPLSTKVQSSIRHWRKFLM